MRNMRTRQEVHAGTPIGGGDPLTLRSGESTSIAISVGSDSRNNPPGDYEFVGAVYGSGLPSQTSPVQVTVR